MTMNKEKTSTSIVKQRISKACQTCASRRRKCDGDRPRCSMCKRIGVECVYVDSGKKRGRPSRPPVHSPISSLSAGSHGSSRSSYGMINGLPSTSTMVQAPVVPSSFLRDTAPTSFISTSPEERYLPFFPANHQRQKPLEPDVLQHLTALLISWEATDRRESNTVPLKLLTAQKVRFHFDIFWRHVHSHWQILYKPGFTSIPETRLANEVQQPVLDAVICLTATMAARTERDRSTVETICQTATMDILSKLITPSLSVVQALFLHSLRFYGIGDLKRASLFTSNAWQLCIDLGLHLDDRTSHRDPGKRQAKLRALWSCYCLDKLLAAEMERVPAFRSDGLKAELLSEYEPDEFEIVYQKSDLIPESQAEAQQSLGRLHAASSLNLTVRTFRILEQAMLSAVHLHAGDKVSEADLLASWARSLTLDRELDTLAASWPDQFRLQTRNVLAVPGVACLVISFHLTKIINFRPYLLLQDRLFRSTGNDLNEGPNAQIAAMCCLSSASAIVQLFSAIPKTSLRYISANNAFALFTAASILMPYSIHESLSIAKECHQSVHKCMAWLEDLGKTWPIAKKHRTALDDMAHVLQIPIDLETLTNLSPDVPAQVQNQTSNSTQYGTKGDHVNTSIDGIDAQDLASHNKVTSPLGFRGQLALRPFATELSPDMSDNSTLMTSDDLGQEDHGGRNRTNLSNRTGQLDLQTDLMQFLDAESDSTNMLDELYLDPSIQALVRQSLSRDTSLWDSSGFKIF